MYKQKITSLQMKWLVFWAMILHWKAILGWGQPRPMRSILLGVMPLVQNRSLNLLTSSPAHYHCTADAPPQTSLQWTLLFYIYCVQHKDKMKWINERNHQKRLRHWEASQFCSSKLPFSFAHSKKPVLKISWKSCEEILRGLNISRLSPYSV